MMKQIIHIYTRCNSIKFSSILSALNFTSSLTCHLENQNLTIAAFATYDDCDLFTEDVTYVCQNFSLNKANALNVT